MGCRQGGSTWENTTHRRRVWSIDFSDVDPTKLASGSDDGTVRVFSTTTKESVCVLNNRANVCSVKFHPTSAHLLAIGSADHKVPLLRFASTERSARNVARSSQGGVLRALGWQRNRLGVDG